jgi:hypothetical protein
MKFIAAAAILSVAAAAGISGPAQAKGCLKGAAVGGLAGHMVNHGVLGAGAGCVVGHHEANKPITAVMAKRLTITDVTLLQT